MSQWWTAARISEQFAVGENRLLSFSQRGNLPSRRVDGVWLFDIETVRNLFRPRDPALAASLPPNSLGHYRLGETWPAPEVHRVSRREQNRRKVGRSLACY